MQDAATEIQLRDEEGDIRSDFLHDLEAPADPFRAESEGLGSGFGRAVHRLLQWQQLFAQLRHLDAVVAEPHRPA